MVWPAKLLLGILIGIFGLPMIAEAVCPLCTFAVSAGVGLTQYLGVDDVITGLWLGGFLVSLTLWSNGICERWYHGHGVLRVFLLTGMWFGSCYFTLWLTGYLGHPLNRLWGVDKLLLGGGIGAFSFSLAYLAYLWLRRRYGRSLFPFQKVIMPVAVLLGLSFLFNEVVI